MPEPDVDALLAKVSELALAFPRAGTKLSHGQHAFQIGTGKMFAYFWYNGHIDHVPAVCVKTSGPEEQEMLLDSPDDLYIRLPYLGPAGWLGIRLDRPPIDWDHVDARLRSSYRLVAPARLAEMV